jgi:hypothetical protein
VDRRGACRRQPDPVEIDAMEREVTRRPDHCTARVVAGPHTPGRTSGATITGVLVADGAEQATLVGRAGGGETADAASGALRNIENRRVVRRARGRDPSRRRPVISCGTGNANVRLSLRWARPLAAKRPPALMAGPRRCAGGGNAAIRAASGSDAEGVRLREATRVGCRSLGGLRGASPLALCASTSPRGRGRVIS